MLYLLNWLSFTPPYLWTKKRGTHRIHSLQSYLTPYAHSKHLDFPNTRYSLLCVLNSVLPTSCSTALSIAVLPKWLFQIANLKLPPTLLLPFCFHINLQKTIRTSSLCQDLSHSHTLLSILCSFNVPASSPESEIYSCWKGWKVNWVTSPKLMDLILKKWNLHSHFGKQSGSLSVS